MVFSIGGFLLNDTGQVQSVKHNGYNIYREGNVWITKIEGKKMPFSYLPAQLESIEAEPGFQGILLGKASVYSTFTLSSSDLAFVEIARFELAQDLPNFFAMYPVEGVANLTSSYSLPFADCTNSTQYMPVIMMQPYDDYSVNSSNGTALAGRIFVKDNCLILEGHSSAFIMLKDRLMYQMAGVMQ